MCCPGQMRHFTNHLIKSFFEDLSQETIHLLTIHCLMKLQLISLCLVSLYTLNSLSIFLSFSGSVPILNFFSLISSQHLCT